MVTVTLTEFNRQPSRLARLAENGPVVVSRFGEPYLVISRAAQSADHVAVSRARGTLRPAATPTTAVLTRPAILFDDARGTLDELDAEGDPFAV